MDAGTLQYAQEESKSLVKPSLVEGLKQKKQKLESQLSEIDSAIIALEENPQIAKVLELVGKASRY